MAGTYRPMLRYYRQPLWLVPLLPFTAFLYLLRTVDSVVPHRALRGRGQCRRARRWRRTGEWHDFRSTPGRYAGEPDNQPLALET